MLAPGRGLPSCEGYRRSGISPCPEGAATVSISTAGASLARHGGAEVEGADVHRVRAIEVSNELNARVARQRRAGASEVDRFDGKAISMGGKKRADHVHGFSTRPGADAVEETATRTDKWRSMLKKRQLQRAHPCEIVGLAAPPYFRPATDSAQASARGVDENEVECTMPPGWRKAVGGHYGGA